jgi:VanZ family protein
LLALAATALALAGIGFATLCPPELRPHLAGADQERFGAYVVLGVFAALAYPRRANAVVFAVAAIAFALEAGQLLVPGRDAGFSDACVKAVGGLWGVFAVQSGYAIRRRLLPADRDRSATDGARAPTGA